MFFLFFFFTISFSGTSFCFNNEYVATGSALTGVNKAARHLDKSDCQSVLDSWKIQFLNPEKFALFFCKMQLLFDRNNSDCFAILHLNYFSSYHSGAKSSEPGNTFVSPPKITCQCLQHLPPFQSCFLFPALSPCGFFLLS